MAAMRQRIAGIDGEIKQAMDRQVAIVSNTMKKDHEHALQLTNMQSQSDSKIKDSTIANLSQSCTSKDQQISQLQIELRDANDRAKDIAQKAVEASSGRQALEAVQRQTELTQQPNNSKR